MLYSTQRRGSITKRGWISWGILVFCFFLAFIHRTAVGTVREYLEQSFALTGTAFGLMSSMYFYAYMLMQIPVGLLADSWGARKTVTTGMLLGGLATLLFGLAPSPYLLFAGRFFVGIGMAMIFVCIMKIQSQWFSGAMFGTLSGIAIFFGNLGGAAGQAPFALLTDYLNWRYAFVVIAVITLTCGVLCLLFVRNRPQDIGLPSIVPPKKGGATVSLIDGLKQVVRQRKMWWVALFYAFNQAAFIAFVGNWLVPWLREIHRMSVTTAASFGMLTTIGIMFGSIASGTISDRLKLRKPVMITGSVIATIMWAGIAFVKNDNTVILGAALLVMGFAMGVFPLSMAITKEVNPIAITGTAIAVLNTVGFFGIAVVTSLLGVVADFTSTVDARFESVIVACLILSLLSTISACLSYETHAKNINEG